MKTEPEVFSIEDLARRKRAPWDGVRNYQARNFMRDQMRVGDLVLFYHSSTEPPGVAGLARVCREAVPDPTAWNSRSRYFDPRSTPNKPVWMMVELEFMEKFPRLVSLEEMRQTPALKGMMLLRRGMRLSIQPVNPSHFNKILELGCR